MGLLCALAVGAPCWLYVQNSPRIKAGNTRALTDYSRETIADLPSKPAIVLCDDPLRLELIEAAYSHEGKVNKNIMIETASLPNRDYISYLVSRYPELRSVTTPPAQLRRVLPPTSPDWLSA